MRARLVAAALVAAPALAQDVSKVEMRAETLAPGVAVLFGAGAISESASGPKAFINGDAFVAAVHASLLEPARKHRH